MDVELVIEEIVLNAIMSIKIWFLVNGFFTLLITLKRLMIIIKK